MNHVNGKPTNLAVPRLENGDRLTRFEFERRYEAMPKPCKAELVEGVVFMASPIRWFSHGGPHIDMNTWLGAYRAATPGTDAADNSTIRLDLDNVPQPDAVLMILPQCGGQAIFTSDDYVERAPELVVEVAASSVSLDLGSKLQAYRRNGVREYIVWRVLDQAIDWFILRNGAYVPLSGDPTGLLKSEKFPGLWLNVAAMLQRDLATVLMVLQQGLASPEHSQFVADLEARGKS